jgi:3-oxoadipate enol-lactonase
MRSRLPIVAAISLFLSPVLALDIPAVPQPHGTHWALANGVHLRYELSGTGANTVVLLHEMSATLETWDYVVPALARTHRVLRYDMRGWGLSERIKGPITLDDEVEDLRQLLVAVGIKGKVALVGGAVGGAVALKFAAMHPDLVKGVAAISPAAYMQDQLARLDSAPTGAPPSSGTPEEQAKRTAAALDAAFPPQLQKAHPERLARFLAMQSAADRSTSGPTTRAAYAVAFSEVMPRIQSPVTIVATSLWMRPVASFKELADAVPKGKTVVVETGHFAAIESPELIIPVIQNFLKEVD